MWLSIAVCVALCTAQGHLAVNNSFLVTTSHALALRFNDISPLENMHIATAFEIAAKPGHDIFESLAPEDRREVCAVWCGT
jgi:hypothetical protein